MKLEYLGKNDSGRCSIRNGGTPFCLTKNIYSVILTKIIKIVKKEIKCQKYTLMKKRKKLLKS